MSGVLAGFAVVGAVILAGYIAARLRIGGPETVKALTQTAFFITNPALLFTILAQADLTAVLSAYLPIALFTAIFAALLYVVISRVWFRRPAAETAIGAMAGSYVNANNIGIPIAVYALGNATAVAPVLLVQLLLLTPVYLTILDLSSGRKPSVKNVLTQPFRNPMIIASFLGLAVSWSGRKVPELVWEPLQLLGGAAVPLVLLAFGMSLRGSRPLRASEGRTEVIVATLIKVFVMPATAYVLSRFLFQLDNELVFGAVVMSALPAAQNVFLLAGRYNRGITVARDVILLSSALSVPALILIAWLLT
ncbi:AEC family transporter [Arthrobacter sp. H20]|uniref:AEC family transporter n=1 Tax=Arthrobacter sp. H20 TaxID=1267981 RepID=UPI00047B3D43|nr:AEC family transporter [Arthrobacter sp. H20]